MSTNIEQTQRQQAPTLIGIIGTEGAGKDTLADYLVEKYGYTKYSMAQPIKEIAKIMFGWTDDQLNNRTKDQLDTGTGIVPREFFKWFGTDITQYTIYDQFPSLNIARREMWVGCMKRAVADSATPVVIPDIRFLHEAKAVKELGGKLVYLSNTSTLAASAMYDIPELIDPGNKWLDSTICNPRISIPDFHARIHGWFTRQFISECENSTVSTQEEKSIKTTRYDTSNLSLYI